MYNIRAVVVSGVGAAVQSGAVDVVGVVEAVIGMATPIRRPVPGAIGATREMTGSLRFSIASNIRSKERTVSYAKQKLEVAWV